VVDGEEGAEEGAIAVGEVVVVTVEPTIGVDIGGNRKVSSGNKTEEQRLVMEMIIKMCKKR
jgi:hypothetical protein